MNIDIFHFEKLFILLCNCIFSFKIESNVSASNGFKEVSTGKRPSNSGISQMISNLEKKHNVTNSVRQTHLQN
jgi:hypothetical protein